MNTAIVQRHLLDLSHGYTLKVADDYSKFIVKDFRTPPGYDFPVIEVMVELPPDYAVQPPGVPPSSVYVPAELRYLGRVPADFHTSPAWKGWAWWCFRSIAWDPCRDDLATFMELLRATMTNPST